MDDDTKRNLGSHTWLLEQNRNGEEEAKGTFH